MNPTEATIGIEPVIIINAKGVVLDAQESAIAALGWTRQELLANSLSVLFEYGYDQVMNCLLPLQEQDQPEGMTISALVLKRDQTYFPTTVLVRYAAEVGRFSLTFGDWPSLEEAPLDCAPVAEPNRETDLTLADVQDGLQKPNRSASSFRNIFLSGAKKSSPQPPIPREENGSTSRLAAAGQLEAERQERRRLEARIVSLNDQLQQLHLQLKNNLESESIYQKRVAELDERIRNAEQSRAEAEATLLEEQQKRERLEHDWAEMISGFEQQERERTTRQAEWLRKLQTTLAALHDAETQAEKETATRRNIELQLQALQRDFTQG